MVLSDKFQYTEIPGEGARRAYQEDAREWEREMKSKEGERRNRKEGHSG